MIQSALDAMRQLLKTQFINKGDGPSSQSVELSDYQASVIFNGTRDIERLQKLVIEGYKVVQDFLPNVGKCVLQDYERLNLFCVNAAREEVRYNIDTVVDAADNPYQLVQSALRRAEKEMAFAESFLEKGRALSVGNMLLFKKSLAVIRKTLEKYQE